MRARHGIIAVALAGLVTLAGCSSGDDGPLMNLAASSDGPDEFAILPSRPLQMPDDLAALPEPTPGGSNRTDPQPRAEAVAALGGNPALLAASAAPVSDGSLINHATRFGVQSGIRDQLAAEDLEFRRQNRGLLLERLFNVNVYYRAYRVMALDRYAELERWRAAGARTPAAPPDPRLEAD
ncbi:DUF3035 domain-containing protein [Alkalilacustris brevis]|uniref:DUF3035 domain-containing protein n=1 Tax=Alkalilacustris brevis TaxID=2026338 RepID=UPI000E0CCEF9|nr:DUF3035 domain-containing protein [Alkalilacustris brevis]